MNSIRTVILALLCLFSTTLLADSASDKAQQIAGKALTNTKAGGFQFIYNKSNRYVVIELGDFFPTPYRLAPGETTMAYVSTDRQAITIRSAD
jgi:hypothetical protein